MKINIAKFRVLICTRNEDNSTQIVLDCDDLLEQALYGSETWVIVKHRKKKDSCLRHGVFD